MKTASGRQAAEGGARGNAVGGARRTLEEASNQPCVTVADMITNVYRAEDIRPLRGKKG